MTALAPLFLALLAQGEPEPAAAPAPAPAAAAAPAPAAVPAGAPGGFPVRAPAGGKPINPQEVSRQLERIKSMPPEERKAATEQLTEQVSSMAGIKPGVQVPEGANIIDAEGFAALAPVEQVRLMARIFVSHLIAGDARNLVLLSSFPFQLEDRRLATPEELHKEWLKSLRSKRTDVLTLYGVDVFTPAEMEKKYGKPPARLANLPVHSPNTWITVSNLSGHAAIVVFRLERNEWQAVAYTD